MLVLDVVAACATRELWSVQRELRVKGDVREMIDAEGWTRVVDAWAVVVMSVLDNMSPCSSTDGEPNGLSRGVVREPLDQSKLSLDNSPRTSPISWSKLERWQPLQQCPNLARFGKARNISHGQVMPTKILRQSINALSIAVLISQGLLRVFPSDGCLARHYKTDTISYGDQWRKESITLNP